MEKPASDKKLRPSAYPQTRKGQASRRMIVPKAARR
jgi:hypothetical protein